MHHLPETFTSIFGMTIAKELSSKLKLRRFLCWNQQKSKEPFLLVSESDFSSITQCFCPLFLPTPSSDSHVIIATQANQSLQTEEQTGLWDEVVGSFVDKIRLSHDLFWWDAQSRLEFDGGGAFFSFLFRHQSISSKIVVHKLVSRVKRIVQSGGEVKPGAPPDSDVGKKIITGVEAKWASDQIIHKRCPSADLIERLCLCLLLCRPLILRSPRGPTFAFPSFHPPSMSPKLFVKNLR